MGVKFEFVLVGADDNGYLVDLFPRFHQRHTFWWDNSAIEIRGGWPLIKCDKFSRGSATQNPGDILICRISGRFFTGQFKKLVRQSIRADVPFSWSAVAGYS